MYSKTAKFERDPSFVRTAPFERSDPCPRIHVALKFNQANKQTAFSKQANNIILFCVLAITVAYLPLCNIIIHQRDRPTF